MCLGWEQVQFPFIETSLNVVPVLLCSLNGKKRKPAVQEMPVVCSHVRVTAEMLKQRLADGEEELAEGFCSEEESWVTHGPGMLEQPA